MEREGGKKRGGLWGTCELNHLGNGWSEWDQKNEGEANTGQGAQVCSRYEQGYGSLPFLGGPKVSSHRALVAVNQALASWTCHRLKGSKFKWGQQKEYDHWVVTMHTNYQQTVKFSLSLLKMLELWKKTSTVKLHLPKRWCWGLSKSLHDSCCTLFIWH